MPRHLLSKSSLKAKVAEAQARAAAKSTTVRVSDGDGLLLAVRATGAAWVLRHTKAGKDSDLTLGRYPAVDLDSARGLADAARAKLAQGVDPAAERQAKRQAEVAANKTAAASGDCVRQLLEDYLDKRVASAKYRTDITVAFKRNVLPAIGALAPHAVTREHITTILRAIEARGAHGVLRKVRMWLRQIFEYGIDDESRPLLEANPVPQGMLKSYKKAPRARHFPALTNPAEVPELMRKIRGIHNNWIIRNALLLSAHLWQRPTEIREAVWEEFDLDAAKWVIPEQRMKLAHEHWVPLSRQVVALLRLHQGIVGDTGWLFPGRKQGQPISEGTLTSRLNDMGYEGRHCPHGFRAMARTIGREHLKIEKDYLEKQLSHEVDDSGLRGAYDRAEYWDDRVAMMQQWSDWLDAQT